MKRRKPNWLKAFNGIGLEELVEAVKIKYEEYIAEEVGRKKVLINVTGNKRYRNILLKFLEVLGSILSEEKLVLKNKIEVIKITGDYIKVLDSYHKKLGHRGFFINQLVSGYAVEMFQDWVLDNYGNWERYLKIGFESREKKEERINKVEEFGDDVKRYGEMREAMLKKFHEAKENSKIAGLLEIDF